MNLSRWFGTFRAPADGEEMSFFDHLEELRWVLLSCLGAVVVAAVGGWYVSSPLLDYLITHTVGQAQFIKVQEAFYTRFKLALLLGFIAALPFVAYRIWNFVVPGLLQRERRVVYPLVIWSTILFLIGVAFSAFILTPTMVRFLTSFGTERMVANLSVGFMLDFYIRMAFACGILFQLPLVVAILSLFGIITPGFLKSKWRHAIVVILILSAMVTPTDMMSQLMLGLPVILLYFISIYISVMIYRAKPEESDEDEERPEPPPEPAPTGRESEPPPEPIRRDTEPPPDPEPPPRKPEEPGPLHPSDSGDWSI